MPVSRAPQPLPLDQADRPYLIDPLEGYSRPADPDLRDRVHNAWRDLLEASDTEGALRVGSELLEADPELPPAQVLIAQVDFAAGDDRLVVQRLLSVGDSLPTYTASQLLIGRAAEKLGDVALAYSAFRAIARNPLAFKRAGELHPRALEIVSNRLDEALRTHSTPEAEKQLGFLEKLGALRDRDLRGGPQGGPGPGGPQGRAGRREGAVVPQAGRPAASREPR